jgi:hypothetical protein
MSAQGKINSLKAGTAGVEVMQWAVQQMEALSDLVEVLRMGQPNIDYDKELLKPTFVGRELTDEEIYEVWCDAIKEEAIVNKGKPPILKYQPFVFFARAILRKAQEK